MYESRGACEPELHEKTRVMGAGLESRRDERTGLSSSRYGWCLTHHMERNKRTVSYQQQSHEQLVECI